ncbi:hypothetical protein CWO08_04705 [Vibrio sp. 10N.286.48.B8]|nr:hypothetical protein CWO08_04705 [Vibrio sp. 10N.286.48.B8]
MCKHISGRDNLIQKSALLLLGNNALFLSKLNCVYLFICLSVYLFICLSVYLFICLSPNMNQPQSLFHQHFGLIFYECVVF